jgi:hypothetical protein
VLESGSGQPILLAELALLDTAMAVIDRTFSDQDCAFLLQSPLPGSFYVRAGALGYRTKLDGIAELAEGGVLTVVFLLVPEPLALEEIEATVERKRIRDYLELQGFYERLADGGGHFITPEETERRNPRDFVRLFQMVPQVEVQGSLSYTRVDLTRCYYSRLPPAIWVDGIQVSLGWGKKQTRRWLQPVEKEHGLESVVLASDIVAAEVYSGPASTPIQWTGTNILETCGTIVIWTKGGR